MVEIKDVGTVDIPDNKKIIMILRIIYRIHLYNAVILWSIFSRLPRGQVFIYNIIFDHAMNGYKMI